ncbi:MAG: hypothetical protein EZS28_041459 [Streblomastix strix]|uniref:Uncharacterized protein n=1 Tax=Streblomastix strix TaxID=222440 RepID=A0A5J4TXH1_9EUKA|nr:MAG: hypothetical protein EZS28_041459 [Streblomastix strix]
MIPSNNAGWIPESSQNNPQFVTLDINNGLSKVGSMLISLTDPLKINLVQIQFGKLKVNGDINDYEDYDFETVWNGENDKVIQLPNQSFKIQAKGAVKFIRIQLIEKNNSYNTMNRQKQLGIISFTVLASRQEKIKFAKLNAILHRQCQITNDVDDIHKRQIPLLRSISELGIGQGCSSYLTMMVCF